jgi:hypothetical protein
MHRHLTSAALAAGALALLSVAGCSGTSSPASTGPASQPASSPAPAASSPAAAASSPAPAFTGTSSVDACKLLTQAEIAKVVGEAVNPLKPSLPGDKSSCATTDSSTTGKFVSVSISVHSPASSQSMSLIRPRDAKNVSGLGSEAYCSGPLLAVLSGSSMVDVTAPNCAQAATLARIALPRL